MGRTDLAEKTSNKDKVRAQFGGTASEYVTSASHAAGEDLEILASWTEGGPEKVALDIATGGGHTALMLSRYYGRVLATDLTDEMLEAAHGFITGQGVSNIEFQRADAEELPFSDEVFDLVSCRIAPHHFGDVPRFVAEVARVLRPGGVFLLEDNVVPNSEHVGLFLNDVERLRDPSHMRALSTPEWRGAIGSVGLEIEAETSVRKRHALDSWLNRAHTPGPARAEVENAFACATPEARQELAIEFHHDGRVVAFTDEKALFKVRKPSTIRPANRGTM